MKKYWVLKDKSDHKIYWESLREEAYLKIPEKFEQISFYWKEKEKMDNQENNKHFCWAIIQPDGELWYESARKTKDLVIQEISNISIYESLGYKLTEIIFYN